MSSTTQLYCSGRPVGRYSLPADLDRRSSPRPCLHPVTTLGGVPVTELAPPDHPHHLGAGVAVPDVEGHNFWGGRTYVRGGAPPSSTTTGSSATTGSSSATRTASWRS